MTDMERLVQILEDKRIITPNERRYILNQPIRNPRTLADWARWRDQQSG